MIAIMADVHKDREFRTITPCIVVKNADAAFAFYERALGAKTREISRTDDNSIMNAQLVIGDSVLMLNDEFRDYDSFAPGPDDKVFTTFHIRSHNIDADFQREIDAGGTVTMPLENQFWGDRYGAFKDPFGYNWSMGQPVSELS